MKRIFLIFLVFFFFTSLTFAGGKKQKTDKEIYEFNIHQPLPEDVAAEAVSVSVTVIDSISHTKTVVASTKN